MRTHICFLLFCCIFLSGCVLTSPDSESPPLLPSDLVVMTYNIHRAQGSDGEVDLERIANVILSVNPDLVALQEVDRFVERTGRIDQAVILQNLTGMNMRFGFAIPYQGGEFGNVILSRYPVDTLRLHMLPGEPGEDRILMEADIIIGENGERSDTLTFLATHLDTFEEPRSASIPIINSVVDNIANRFILLAGDLNARPESAEITALLSRLRDPSPEEMLPTFPAANPERQIDYIFYSDTPDWRVKEVRVLHAPVASDHAPLVVTFQRESQ